MQRGRPPYRAAEGNPMTFKLEVPRHAAPPLEILIASGDALFVLGANGAGKSSLMQRFFTHHAAQSRRISAHRQTWLSSNALSLSASDRLTYRTSIRDFDNQPSSRWTDDYTGARPRVSIYDLVDAENVRAREITRAVDQGDMELAKRLAEKDAPLTAINQLLRLSNLPVEISVQDTGEVLASKSGSVPYSIAELSDGERNALLVAADVLTIPPGTLVLIDEPERHLHRAIISPLLNQLFAKRKDCAFVVSTHEVMLPLDSPEARTLLLRDCFFSDGRVEAWDVDELLSGAEVDDDLKMAILGARRRIIFVEGDEGSLDKPLYALLFPGASVIAKRGCREVEQAVAGIRSADELHWVRAYGIVDGDGRPPSEVERLRANGVYALSVHSVESLYYCPELQKRVAERHATVTGQVASELINAARHAALGALAPHVQRLSERVAERSVREEVVKALPNRAQITAGSPINLSIDVAAIVASERKRLENALQEGKLDEIIAHYPVRETPALDQIATRLGFQDRAQYESAIRTLLIDDPESLQMVGHRFEQLAADFGAIFSPIQDIADGPTSGPASD
jgi:ABC-type cobalamin/Fe3+-siderophores transport system ATPase subunit